MQETSPAARDDVWPAGRSRGTRGVRRVVAAVFLWSCALNLYAWYVNPARPSMSDNVVTGWYGGASDQINYAHEARALAKGELPGIHMDYVRGQAKPDAALGETITDYAYGLGYPLLGVPFVKIGLRRDPFVVPDAIGFALIICMALLLARRFTGDAAALVFAAALAVASPVLRFTVMPWNTTVTAVAVLAALLFATAERRTWKTGLALGIALALCYAARYTDVVWPALIAAAGSIPRRREDVKRNIVALAVAVAVVMAAYAAVGWTHHVIFGNFFTNPYHSHFHNGNRGDSLAEFRFSQVPRAFAELFVTATAGPHHVAEPHTSVLRAFPWVIAAPFGLVLLVRGRNRHAMVVLVAVTASIAASTFYLAYWSGTGADLENNNLRFFVPWFPLWGLLAAIALEQAVGHGAAMLAGHWTPAQGGAGSLRRWAIAAAAVLLILAGAVFSTMRPRVEVDLAARLADAEKRPISAGAETFSVRQQKIGGDARRAILAYPPTRLTWRLVVPDYAELQAGIGIAEDAWTKDGDGAVFVIGIGDAAGYTELLRRHVDPAHQAADRRWLPVKIDLARFAGRRVSLIFSTDASLPGANDTRNDFAYWGAPVISGYQH